MKSGGIIYFDLNKKGTNGHKFKVKSITILGITLKAKVWRDVLIIASTAAVIAAIGYKMRLYERKIDVLSSGYKVYAQVEEQEKTFSDPRAEKVYKFLKGYNSPLAPYAELIVSEADRNGIPYTLVPAIAGKESSFGKHLANSYNAWGITGGKETRFRAFDSWADAIKNVSQLLGDHYLSDMVAGIQTRYCPSFECSTTWTNDVTGFAEAMK